MNRYYARARYYENVDLSNAFIVRLKSNDNIREKIGEVISKNRLRRAVILSAIGSVREAAFYGIKLNSKLPYNQQQITVIQEKGPFEVLTMEGNILPEDKELVFHIHATFGRHDGTVIGGHLENATVYTTIELFLAEIRKSLVVKCSDDIAGGVQIKLPLG